MGWISAIANVLTALGGLMPSIIQLFRKDLPAIPDPPIDGGFDRTRIDAEIDREIARISKVPPKQGP